MPGGVKEDRSHVLTFARYPGSEVLLAAASALGAPQRLMRKMCLSPNTPESVEKAMMITRVGPAIPFPHVHGRTLAWWQTSAFRPIT